MKLYTVKIDTLDEIFKAEFIKAVEDSKRKYNRIDNYFTLTGKDNKWNVNSIFIKKVENFYPTVEILTAEEFKKKYLISKLQGG